MPATTTNTEFDYCDYLTFDSIPAEYRPYLAFRRRLHG